MTDADDPHRFRNLRGCHPELARRVRILIDALAEIGFDVVLTQGVRSAAQQQALFSQGRSKPGKIVTNCDGIVHVSNHQVKANGYGYAVDVAWRDEEKVLTWNGPWEILGSLAASSGLVWGGHWTFPDRCHLELSLPVLGAERFA